MRLRFLLAREGLFVNYPVPIEPTPEIVMWRAVLDQALRDAVSVNTHLAKDAIEWVNAEPHTFKTIVDGNSHVVVDLHQEFVYCSRNAGFEPEHARESWNAAYAKIQEEDKTYGVYRRKPDTGTGNGDDG